MSCCRIELCNLVNDPSEIDNLAGQLATATVQQELMGDLITWILRTQDPLTLPRQRYVMKRDERNYWTTR